MAECKSYTYEVTEKSPLYPLVLAMKADGVTDAGRDGGYAQIDYSAPWKPAKIVGAGDCFVDAREDEERGLENWRKYRKELAQYYGAERLMWEFYEAPSDPQSPKKKKNKEKSLLDRVCLAIGEIRGEMEKQKIDPASDEYKQKMAEALFYFYEFPSKTKWASYDGAQKKEVMARMKRLDGLNLSHFKAYLVKNGGCNHFYYYAASPESDYNPFGTGFGGTSAGSASLLFAMCEEAGLDPSFMEIMDNEPKNFVCGMPQRVMYGVGIPLASGWRVFNTSNHDTDVKRGLVYPLNLRQAAGSSQLLTRAIDALVTRTPSDMDFERVFSADGFVSSYSNFGNLAAKLAKEDNVEAKKTFEGYVKRHKSEFHPLLGSFLDLQLNAGEGKADSAAPQDPLAAFMWLFDRYEEIKKDDVQAQGAALRLLSLDPKCVVAHVTLAKLGAEGMAAISDAEIEDHYAKALAGIPQGHDSKHSLDVKWGAFYLKRGRINEARQKFEAALSGQTTRDGTRAEAAYYLALIDTSLAGEFLKKAFESVKKDLGKLDDESDAKEWFDWLKKIEKENPEMHKALKDNRDLSAELAPIWAIVGKALLSGKKFKEAIEALEYARSMSGQSDLGYIEFTLHEAYLQSGDLGNADKMFEGVFK